MTEVALASRLRIEKNGRDLHDLRKEVRVPLVRLDLEGDG